MNWCDASCVWDGAGLVCIEWPRTSITHWPTFILFRSLCCFHYSTILAGSSHERKSVCRAMWEGNCWASSQSPRMQIQHGGVRCWQSAHHLGQNPTWQTKLFEITEVGHSNSEPFLWCSSTQIFCTCQKVCPSYSGIAWMPIWKKVMQISWTLQRCPNLRSPACQFSWSAVWLNVQAHWKGHEWRKRQGHVMKQMQQLRFRMQITASKVDNSQRLGHRLTNALAQLLSQKTVSGILHTCATIGTSLFSFEIWTWCIILQQKSKNGFTWVFQSNARCVVVGTFVMQMWQLSIQSNVVSD